MCRSDSRAAVAAGAAEPLGGGRPGIDYGEGAEQSTRRVEVEHDQFTCLARRRGSGREWAYECAFAREVLQRACARWRARRRARADRGTNRAGPHRTIERARRGALRTADALRPRLSPHAAGGAVWPESLHVRPYRCRRFARICRPCRESRIRLHDEPDGVDTAYRPARSRVIGCDLRVDVNHLRVDAKRIFIAFISQATRDSLAAPPAALGLWHAFQMLYACA